MRKLHVLIQFGVFDRHNSVDAMEQQQGVKVLVRSPGLPMSMAAPVVTARSRVWFNPDLYSRNYFVPGVIANIIMMVTLMLSALGIVREKEIATMEQLMVTPVRPVELMLGKTLPFALVGLLDVVLITGVALLVFHIPLNGSFLLLLLCAALFLMTSLGAGLFLSTISHTQQQAMMASFFFSTPAFMLSGFAFPIRNMPAAVQYLTYLNPVRYFIEIVRGIFLKGVGSGSALAADAGYGGLWDGGVGLERDAFSEKAGLKCASAPLKVIASTFIRFGGPQGHGDSLTVAARFEAVRVKQAVLRKQLRRHVWRRTPLKRYGKCRAAE
jgi:ABC-type multidrug transport system permease subunit